MIHNLRPRRGGSKRRTTLGGSKERPGSKERTDSKERSPSKERSDSKEDRAGSKTRAGSKIHEEPPRTLPHDDQTLGACFSENCEMIVTASGWEHGHAVVFDLQSLDEILRIPHSDWVMQASFSPVNCMYVLTACKDKTARVWELPKQALYGQARQDAKDAKARAEQEEKEANAGKKKLVVSKRKAKELAEAAEAAKVQSKLISLELLTFPHSNYNLCAQWSPDGKQICTGSDTGSIQIFNVAFGEQLWKLDQSEPILDIQFASNGRKLCTASTDASARVYAGLQTLWAKIPCSPVVKKIVLPPGSPAIIEKK